AVVRTLLAIDEEAGSMTFAGDIPEGSSAQLMKANFDKLIDASYDAAEGTVEALGGAADLAILVSCVGRKLILDQRIEEEVEEVRSVLGDDTKISGFYSYGEISPLTPSVNCELHNQTMTITTFSEN
ncbi:MAG TPA: histidine kinase, partial [Flavobacteriales bacterium]|nr:histidine kinase [Flavobacteriales bacterium]